MTLWDFANGKIINSIQFENKGLNGSITKLKLNYQQNFLFLLINNATLAILKTSGELIKKISLYSDKSNRNLIFLNSHELENDFKLGTTCIELFDLNNLDYFTIQTSNDFPVNSHIYKKDSKLIDQRIVFFVKESSLVFSIDKFLGKFSVHFYTTFKEEEKSLRYLNHKDENIVKNFSIYTA